MVHGEVGGRAGRRASGRILRGGLLLLVICLLAGGTGLPAAAQAGEPRVLRPGMWGEDVFNLQRLLIRVGFELPATGIYGEMTTAAVRQVQRYGGLAVDGVAGPATIAFLQELAARPRYVVQPGDTLYDLARRFGLSMTDLVDANLLQSTTLRPGQELVIPGYWIYSVRQGETLGGLARRFGVNANTLARSNGLATNASLKAGQALWVPLPDW